MTTKKEEKKNKVSFYLDKAENFINKYWRFFFFGILGLGIFLRLYDITNVPYGINVDEAGMAYDAWSLANFGVDRYLKPYPVYLINFGGGQSAMYAYLAMINFKIFGFSIFTMRLPAAFMGITAIVCSYFMVRKYTTKGFSLLFMFIITIIPWHIMQSRFGLDCDLLASFFIISVFLLTRAHNFGTYIITGIFFGFTLYTYALAYIIVPIFLFLSLIYLIYLRKIKITQLICLGVPLFFIALPLILMILVNNKTIPEITGMPFTITVIPGYRKNEIKLENIRANLTNLSLFKMLLTNDFLVYNTLPEFGTLYYMTIPFFILGLGIAFKRMIVSVKEKKVSLEAIILFAFTSATMCSLLIIGPNINKSNAIFIPIVFLAVLGISYISNKDRKALVVIIAMYSINFINFSKFYFEDYPKVYVNQPYFDHELINLVQHLEANNEYKDKQIYIETYAEQPYIYALLAQLASPYDFQNGEAIGNYHFRLSNLYSISNIYAVKGDNHYNALLQKDFTCEVFENFKIMSHT